MIVINNNKYEVISVYEKWFSHNEGASVEEWKQINL